MKFQRQTINLIQRELLVFCQLDELLLPNGVIRLLRENRLKAWFLQLGRQIEVFRRAFIQDILGFAGNVLQRAFNFYFGFDTVTLVTPVTLTAFIPFTGLFQVAGWNYITLYFQSTCLNEYSIDQLSQQAFHMPPVTLACNSKYVITKTLQESVCLQWKSNKTLVPSALLCKYPFK